MKKFIYAIAAGALMASCIQQGLDAEGQKAWDNFKEISATFETTEIAYDTLTRLLRTSTQLARHGARPLRPWRLTCSP